jgi:putative Mn2+ efflux pump MntP
MIKDAIVKEDIIFNYLDLFTILFLGIATSIDAFVVGITLPYLNINLFTTICIIFIITFILCFIGTYIGSKINNYKLYQIVGGLTLFAIGLKILFEHLKII